MAGDEVLPTVAGVVAVAKRAEPTDRTLVERVDDGLLVGLRIARGVLGRLEGVWDLLQVGRIISVSEIRDLPDRVSPAPFDGLVARLSGPAGQSVDVGLGIELGIGFLKQRDPFFSGQAVCRVAGPGDLVVGRDRHALVDRHVDRRTVQVEANAVAAVAVVDEGVDDQRGIDVGDRPEAGHDVAGA